MSAGVISALERQVDRYELPCVMSTADISEGSSGGALLNVYGQAVAVTTGAYVYGNSMYLAVPIDPVLLRRPDRRGPVPSPPCRRPSAPRHDGVLRLKTERDVPETGTSLFSVRRSQWERMNRSSSSGVETTAAAPASASSPGAA